MGDLSFKWMINSLSMSDICLCAAVFHLHVIIDNIAEDKAKRGKTGDGLCFAQVILLEQTNHQTKFCESPVCSCSSRTFDIFFTCSMAYLMQAKPMPPEKSEWSNTVFLSFFPFVQLSCYFVNNNISKSKPSLVPCHLRTLFFHIILLSFYNLMVCIPVSRLTAPPTPMC